MSSLSTRPTRPQRQPSDRAGGSSGGRRRHSSSPTRGVVLPSSVPGSSSSRTKSPHSGSSTPRGRSNTLSGHSAVPVTDRLSEMRLKAFLKVMNNIAGTSDVPILEASFFEEISDGCVFLELAEAMTGQDFGLDLAPSSSKVHRFENMRVLFDTLRGAGVLPSGFKPLEIAESSSHAHRALEFVYQLLVQLLIFQADHLFHNPITSLRELRPLLVNWCSEHVKQFGLKAWNLTSSLQDGRVLLGIVSSILPHCPYRPMERPPPGVRFAELKALNLIRAMESIEVEIGVPSVYDRSDPLACASDEQIMTVYVGSLLVRSEGGGALQRSLAARTIFRFVSRLLKPTAQSRTRKPPARVKKGTSRTTSHGNVREPNSPRSGSQGSFGSARRQQQQHHNHSSPPPTQQLQQQTNGKSSRHSRDLEGNLGDAEYGDKSWPPSREAMSMALESMDSSAFESEKHQWLDELEQTFQANDAKHSGILNADVVLASLRQCTPGASPEDLVGLIDDWKLPDGQVMYMNMISSLRSHRPLAGAEDDQEGDEQEGEAAAMGETPSPPEPDSASRLSQLGRSQSSPDVTGQQKRAAGSKALSERGKGALGWDEEGEDEGPVGRHHRDHPPVESDYDGFEDIGPPMPRGPSEDEPSSGELGSLTRHFRVLKGEHDALLQQVQEREIAEQEHMRRSTMVMESLEQEAAELRRQRDEAMSALTAQQEQEQRMRQAPPRIQHTLSKHSLTGGDAGPTSGPFKAAKARRSLATGRLRSERRATGGAGENSTTLEELMGSNPATMSHSQLQDWLKKIGLAEQLDADTPLMGDSFDGRSLCFLAQCAEMSVHKGSPWELIRFLQHDLYLTTTQALLFSYELSELFQPWRMIMYGEGGEEEEEEDYLASFLPPLPSSVRSNQLISPKWGMSKTEAFPAAAGDSRQNEELEADAATAPVPVSSILPAPAAGGRPSVTGALSRGSVSGAPSRLVQGLTSRLNASLSSSTSSPLVPPTSSGNPTAHKDPTQRRSPPPTSGAAVPPASPFSSAVASLAASTAAGGDSRKGSTVGVVARLTTRGGPRDGAETQAHTMPPATPPGVATTAVAPGTRPSQVRNVPPPPPAPALNTTSSGGASSGEAPGTNSLHHHEQHEQPISAQSHSSSVSGDPNSAQLSPIVPVKRASQHAKPSSRLLASLFTAAEEDDDLGFDSSEGDTAGAGQGAGDEDSQGREASAAHGEFTGTEGEGEARGSSSAAGEPPRALEGRGSAL